MKSGRLLLAMLLCTGVCIMALTSCGEDDEATTYEGTPKTCSTETYNSCYAECADGSHGCITAFPGNTVSEEDCDVTPGLCDGNPVKTWLECNCVCFDLQNPERECEVPY